MNFIRGFFLLFAVAFAGAVSAAPSDWDEPFTPHRIADRLYYVGSRGLASYFVTTSKGHILINSSFERTLPIIRGNVEKLGFKFTDIKFLLASHAHSDHVQGHGLIKELTGARVEVMAGDDKVIANGGKGQYLYDETWRPCAVDRVLKDGDTITLGEVTLTARHTPGHTRGCTTWTTTVQDGGRNYNVVFFCSLRSPANVTPAIASELDRSFKLVRTLPCDIPLGDHPAEYGMLDKYPKLKAGAPNPFVDGANCFAEAEVQEAMYHALVAEQKSPARP